MSARGGLLLLLLPACAPDTELRYLSWPALAGASQIVASDSSPILMFARASSDALVLGGLAPPSDVYVLDYADELAALGLSEGPIEAASCRACALLTPMRSFRARVEEDVLEPAWEEGVALPSSALDRLLPDREAQCGACRPLTQREMPLIGRGDVTFTAAIDARQNVVIQASGEIQRITDAGAELVCRAPYGTIGGALRGPDELWVSGQDGGVHTLILSAQSPGTPCIATSSIAVPGRAFFQKMAITQAPEAAELVAISGDSVVYHWRAGRWQHLADLVPEERPWHVLWAGGRRFYAGTTDGLLEVDAGVMAMVDNPFRNPGGFPEAVEAITLDTHGALLASIRGIGLVTGLDLRSPSVSLPGLLRVASLAAVPGAVYYVLQDMTVGRAVDGGKCELETLSRGFGSYISAPLGTDGILLGDTAHTDTFPEPWVLRIEPQRSCTPL